MDWEQLKIQIRTNPRNSLHFVAGLAVTLVLLWILVLAQTDSRDEMRYVDIQSLQPERSDTSRSAGTGTGTAPSDTGTAAADGSQEPWSLVPVYLVIAGIGGVFFYGYSKKGKRTSGSNSSRSGKKLLLVETIEISPGQIMAIVEVGDEFWITGSGNQGINLIRSVRKEEWPEQDADAAPESKSGGFPSLLRSIRTGQFPTVN